MLNVITVKWGDKYSSDYVNRLSIMLERNLTIPFRMYCYTDDPIGIDNGINIIDIPKDEYLEGWWNKVGLFKESMPYIGRCLYLDLDTVIQNNIDDLFNYEPDIICGVWTYWNLIYTDGEYQYKKLRWKIPFNSSVMTWNACDYYWIWDHFWENHNDYIMKYYGDDKFLGHELDVYRIFPQEWIYSRLYGNSETDKPTDLINLGNNRYHRAHYYPDAKICLLNGPTTPAYYKKFESLWL